MHREHQLQEQATFNKCSFADVRKGRLDAVVLRYMAQRIHVTLRQLEQLGIVPQHLLYNVQERHGRTHRIAIYKPQELLLKRDLLFVGFTSRKQKDLSPAIIDDIHNVDKKLIAELVNNPGILSYSSLELRTGIWCNLVLLSNADAKTHIKGTETHIYAAYHLAPRCYEWIRLHNGIMPGGLVRNELVLQKTRHYTFQMTPSRPSIRELTY